ncbi:hypothetical protein J7E97_08275 [Streptomyces sp. ISL-66]|uniref:DUF6221 family protein n=1 Tax=Streptomyces sp. ISL-66 TaxID=2819186 RepID=UPI001BEA741C|nr:DUF6221 family protein [Streptomyces sp. ISL-66]MBT2467870.1 hypothetical protein [Streptomyces sp. ISL-66]
MPKDLINFLRARLEEDERLAHLATPGPWAVDGGTVYAGHLVNEIVDYSESADHIARQDPDRILGEVDAKHRLLTMYEEAGRTRFQPPTAERWMAAGVERAVLEDIFRAFAAVYANHPDYCEEWRP